MNQDEIRQHIFQILHRIAPEADLDRLDSSANLRDVLDIDSFDFSQCHYRVARTVRREHPGV